MTLSGGAQSDTARMFAQSHTHESVAAAILAELRALRVPRGGGERP